jgi:hypothetical protein
MARLEMGLPASTAELAVHLGGRITRADYLRLLRARLFTFDALETTADEVLLEHLGNDEDKLAAVRAAVRAHYLVENRRIPPQPILPSPED